MTPDLLYEIGRALYGDGWTSAMAADLGMANDRTIRRIMAGKTEMSPRFDTSVPVLIDLRINQLRVLRTKVEQGD